MRHAGSCIAILGALVALSCGVPTNPTPPVATMAASTDPKDLAEALLVGTGPLADTVNNACHGGIVIGWRSSSDIIVRVSTLLPPSSMGQVEQVVSGIPEATRNNVHAHIETTPDAVPFVESGVITVTATPTPTALGCPGGAALCSMGLAFTPPFLRGSRIVGIPGGNFAHEMGHAVFGFCHTKNPNVFDKETIMVGGMGLTDRDVAMMQSVYDAGLGPGATRADLAAHGIINP